MNDLILVNDLPYRLKQVQQALQLADFDAALLTIDVNLFYLTGQVFNGYLYVPAEGETFSFVKRPANLIGENVASIRKPEQIQEIFVDHGWQLPKKIMLEIDEIPYSECVRLQNTLNQPVTGNATALLRRSRMIKTPWEIQQLQLSAQQHSRVYAQIPQLFKDNMTDLELQAEIEHVMRQHGSIGIFNSFGLNMTIFMGSVLAGDNAENPSPFDFALGGMGQSPICPFGANGTQLKSGTTVMVDMAGNFTPYLTDMTRVFAIGKLHDTAYRAHQVSLEIQHYVQETAKPGISCAEIYEKAVAIAKQNGLGSYFMGTKQQAKFVGHGIGLQINEPPVFTNKSKDVLQENMTFALEPKFVLPGIGAVGIENSFVVTADHVEKITLCDEDILNVHNYQI